MKRPIRTGARFCRRPGRWRDRRCGRHAGRARDRAGNAGSNGAWPVLPEIADTIYGGAEVLSKYLSEATGGKFQIQVGCRGRNRPRPAGAGRRDRGHGRGLPHRRLLQLGQGSDLRAWLGVPFALSARAMNAWQYHGGGIDLFNEFPANYNVVGLPAAIPAPRWAAGSARK